MKWKIIKKNDRHFIFFIAFLLLDHIISIFSILFKPISPANLIIWKISIYLNTFLSWIRMNYLMRSMKFINDLTDVFTNLLFSYFIVCLIDFLFDCLFDCIQVHLLMYLFFYLMNNLIKINRSLDGIGYSESHTYSFQSI